MTCVKCYGRVSKAHVLNGRGLFAGDASFFSFSCFIFLVDSVDFTNTTDELKASVISAVEAHMGKHAKIRQSQIKL